MECRIVDLQDLAYGFLDPDAAARVRDHVADCPRCRSDFARLQSERNRLAGAAAGLSLPRERKSLMPLAFAAALLVGLLWLLIPRESPPTRESLPDTAVVVPAAQEKSAPKGVPDDEESLQKEITRLDAALKSTTDDQERSWLVRERVFDVEPRGTQAARTALVEEILRIHPTADVSLAILPDPTFDNVRWGYTEADPEPRWVLIDP